MPDLRQRQKRGFTLVEMLITLTILAILAAAVMPLAKVAVKREKEIELRRDLRLLRDAIDAYKKLADEKKIEVEEDTEGYPPDLDTLVKGVEMIGEQTPRSAPGTPPAQTKKSREEKKIIKFLRRIPRDPMTDSLEWGLRSYQDEPDDDVWGGENVYDVYTKSMGTALDGTKYRDW
jgi:general secretion pathway protein G